MRDDHEHHPLPASNIPNILTTDNRNQNNTHGLTPKPCLTKRTNQGTTLLTVTASQTRTLSPLIQDSTLVRDPILQPGPSLSHTRSPVQQYLPRAASGLALMKLKSKRPIQTSFHCYDETRKTVEHIMRIPTLLLYSARRETANELLL